VSPFIHGPAITIWFDAPSMASDSRFAMQVRGPLTASRTDTAIPGAGTFAIFGARLAGRRQAATDPR